MSELAEIAPANPSDPTPSPLLEDVFFAPLLQALQVPGITRGCAVVDDVSFAVLAALRVLENSKTGRDFIQTHGMPASPGLTRANYFDGLSSPRRLEMFIALERELQRQQLPSLRVHDDRLAHLGELDEMEIWAGDGHCIAHATHDPRNEKGGYRPVNLIYKLDLRSGWMRFMDLARPTASCPDSDEIYITLTNQMNHTPGSLNQCRRLRWNIEKAFDQQEQKLDERKAWTASETGKRIQAIAMSIVHNLLRLFAAKLKSEEGIQDSKVIRAWQKDLAKRAEKARAAGRTLPGKLYQSLYRPTEVSLQFIRWLRVGLMRPTCYKLAIEQLHPLMRAYL